MSAVLIATLIYLAILVGALAVGLIMIASRLWATAAALTKIRDGLAIVQADTQPLAGYLTGINGALTQLAGGLSSVLARLLRLNAALGRITDKSKVA